MKFSTVVCVGWLAKLLPVDGTRMGADGCSDTTRGMSLDVPQDVVMSGSPIKLSVAGTVAMDSPVIDVGSITIKVETSSRDITGVVSPELLSSSFELDLCTHVVGVECPLKAGEGFEGIAQWNAMEIPHDSKHGAFISAFLLEQGFPTCTGDKDNIVALVKVIGRGFVARTRNDWPAIRSSLVSAVNKRHSASWQAEHSKRFEGYTVEDARRIAGGTVMRGQVGFEELPRRRYGTDDQSTSATMAVVEDGAHPVATARRLRVSGPNLYAEGNEDIPANFDAREAFSQCASIIGRVRDQSDCGSCWAFASTEAFNDRRCIAGLGEDGGEASADQLVMLSAEDTTACCYGFSCGLSMGCNGGQPGSAWKWFTRTGVVTGGGYSEIGQGNTCKPYEFQPCAHHVDPGASGYPACADSEYPTPKCLSKCSEGTFPTSYEEDKKMAKEAYSLGGVQDIQRDMMKFGSVTAAFSVYSDFLTYSGGVYSHVTGSYMGGHAVKIIGWGTDSDSGEDYWLVANSWNSSWGEGGLFRILRGVNACGIEGQVVAGQV